MNDDIRSGLKEIWCEGVKWVHLIQDSSQSSGCTHIHQTCQKSLNKRLPARKLMANCFLEEKMSADGGIYATRDHSNVRSVLRKKKRRVEC
jgi:hypothetical protein